MLRGPRLTLVHAVLVTFAVALVGRSAFVQLWQREKWEAMATRQHYARSTLAAPRGEIQDMSGIVLAQNQVRIRLAVTPQQVKEPRNLTKALRRAGVDNATTRRAIDKRRKWVPINTTFFPWNVTALRAMRGVWSEAVGQRHYVPSAGIRRIVGRTDAEGVGRDGIELTLDSLLRGERGTAAPLLGVRGERYESPTMLTQPPRPGHSVTLTVSYVLQDICDRALVDATAGLRASGGDIVVLDPRSGEIRCLASVRDGPVSTASTALTEPFEPGSTLKPFFAGALIESRKAHAAEVIATFNGVYRTHGRTISDVHKAERLSLADVIRYSSNVGMVRFTERLLPREVFEALRDYGFGTATGVAFPSEASGTLREPRRWTSMSQASLAIGYEIAVTPLQLAIAYAAIANGGELLVPALVKEVRDPDGTVVYTHRRRLVRRVLRPETAKALLDVLASVVDSGTATDAALSTYAFGGKSGTARRVSNGVYASGSYTSTFVGLFPAREPQYVVLVKLDNPRGTYYGGKAAAPVARAVIEATLASRDVALDRSGLALQQARYQPPQVATTYDTMAAAGSVALAVNRRAAVRRDDRPAGAAPEIVPSRYALMDTGHPPARARPARIDLGRPPRDSTPAYAHVVIPDVRALPLRVAVRELHRAGLRVAIVSGIGAEMVPSPGTTVRQGTLVKVGVVRR